MHDVTSTPPYGGGVDFPPEPEPDTDTPSEKVIVILDDILCKANTILVHEYRNLMMECCKEGVPADTFTPIWLYALVKNFCHAARVGFKTETFDECMEHLRIICETLHEFEEEKGQSQD